MRVTCLSLGTSSLKLHYVYTVDDEVAVDARMTTVCVDLKPLKSRPIPDEYRAKFEEILEHP